MAKRVSKDLGTVNPRFNEIKSFSLETLNKDNLINQLLVLKKSDISLDLIMNLFGSFNGSSLCNPYDTFIVPIGAFTFTNMKGKAVSNMTMFRTTVGIWIFNVFLLRDLDLSKVFDGYVNENINSKTFEKMHQKILYALVEDKVEIKNYKEFIELCDFIMPWETILCPSYTDAILSCTKKINAMKKKLIAENKEALESGDPAVAEKIEKQIIDYVVNDLLKDDPALDPYLSGAGGTIGNNFKNMFIMKGAIRDPDPNAKQEFNIATSSFIDGISAEEYSKLANSLAGGPYSRAKKTELGGYWEKLMVSALNTVKIDGPGTDCKTDKYIEVTLTDKNLSMFMYNYIIKSNGELEELTSDNASKYINKKVKMRSALFCKSPGLCNCCAGNFFYRRGFDNPGLACSSIATVLKLRSMRAFHNSTVSTTEIDPIRAFMN